MKPTVSVVMPVYNQKEYVTAAIDSILAQSFTDFEFVIVDDGSTDGTTAILDRIDDSRVTLVHSKHAGFLKALTLGVQKARGRWIARMDSDDISHPERLRRQIDFLEGNSECLFVGSIYGLITPNQKYLAPRETFDWKFLQPSDITFASCLFADPSVVFDRGSALEAGLYDSDFENEKPLWYKLLSRGRGAILGEALHYLRWRIGSHSRSEFARRGSANDRIRLRYDPTSFPPSAESAEVTDSKKATLKYARKGINYYLLAGDHSAAYRVAAEAWRKWPTDNQTLDLLARAFLKRRSLRFWRQPVEDPTFVSVDSPW